jgi:hypothetical protein
VQHTRVYTQSKCNVKILFTRSFKLQIEKLFYVDDLHVAVSSPDMSSVTLLFRSNVAIVDLHDIKVLE